MRKYLFILLVLLIVSNTTVTAQVSLGVEAGPDISKTVTKFGRSKASSQLILGITGGLYAMVPLSEGLFLKPALLYQTKGGSVQVSDGNKIKSYLHYLSLPIDVLFKSPIQDGSGSWLAGLGPYVSYGISSKQTRTDDNSAEVDLFKFGGLKRLDAGVNAMLGFELPSGLNFTVSADIGLLNVAGHGNQDNYNRNKSLSFLVGYTFGRN